MADFDAGSIEGRLDLDLDPFSRGLEEAKAKAAEFERTTTATANASVDVDDDDARAKMAEDNLRLDRLDHKKATAEVRVDNSQASAALASMDRNITKIAGFYNRNSAGGLSGPGEGHGLMFLVGLAASLAPAFGPATAAVGLFGAAGAAAFGGAAVSLALWGKVASGVFKQIQDANKAGKTLDGPLGALQTRLKGLTGAWDDLEKRSAGGIAKAISPLFATLQSVIPKLLPLINSISTGIGGALVPIENLLKSGQFDHFIALLSSNAVKDLPQVGHILANILSGLMGIFTALNPVIQAALPVVVKMTAEFRGWAASGAGDFVTKTFGLIQKYGPETLTLLHNLGGVLGAIGKGLAPLTGPALTFLISLTGALKGIDLAPLATGIGTVLTQLAPFATVLGDIVNTLLPPLGTLLSTIGDSLIGPIGKSLSSELTPALDGLSQMLQIIAPYLGQFLTSIADLANPTGVGLFSTLIKDLVPLVKDLVPPLAHLVIALEGMVDQFLVAVGPTLIPAVTKSLDLLIKALTPVINGLAWFLSHKAVAVTILGIATAVKATTTAMKLWAVATKGIAFISGIIEAISLGWAGLTVAQDANTASTVANRVAMLAWKAVQLAGAAATGIATAATTAFGIALDVALGPVGLIIVAVTALAAAAFLIYKNWDTITSFFGKLWDDVKKIFTNAINAVISWVKSHWDILAIIVAPFLVMPIELAKHWDKVSAFLKKIPGEVRSIFSSAADWLTSAGRAVLNGLFDGLKFVWAHTVSPWLHLGKKIKDIVGDLSQTLYRAGLALIQGLWNGIKDKWDSMKDWFTGHLSDLRDHLPFSPAKKGPFSGRGYTTYAGRALIDGLAEGIRAAAPGAVRDTENVLAGLSATMKRGVDFGVTKGTVRISGPQSAADLYAASQSAAMARLETALTGLSNSFKSASKEEREAMTKALSDAFSTASESSARAVLTEVKKG